MRRELFLDKAGTKQWKVLPLASGKITSVSTKWAQIAEIFSRETEQ